MPVLFVLRHAEPVFPEGIADIDRPLTPAGRRQADSLGAAMAGKGYVPQEIRCSPARRTRETVAGLLRGLPDPGPVYDSKIYNATVGDLYEIVKSLSPVAERALVVGHNPAISGLVAFLCGPTEDVGSVLSGGYKPATLAVIQFESIWADILPGEGRLADIIAPV